MPDPQRGKQLLAQRAEYPLPRPSGTKDYVIYLVPKVVPGTQKRDGFREGGQAFFDRFYKDHVRTEAGTLEQVIDFLAAEVDRGVSHIREIVLLAHANPIGMLPRVLNDVSASGNREYKHITAFSLTCLQQDFAAGKFASFRAKRAKVLGKLTDASWVTIRACRFGNSREGMYAVYAFFGGRANVYCPKHYQFFGTTPIARGMRLESSLEAHEHLVRQHFFPRDVHTPERKDAVVQAIVDKGKFSEPFEIARMRLEDPPPEQAAAYEQVIGQLDAHKVSAALRAAFEANGFALPPKPQVEVVSRRSRWTVTDRTHRHEALTVVLKYDVYESVEVDDRNRRVFVLRAGAWIDDKLSASASLPIQLFLDEHDNEEFRGKVLRLATYADEPPEPDAKARFDAVKAVLDQGSLTAGGLDLAAELAEAKVEIASGTKPVKVSTTGPAAAPRITWALSDGQHRYTIMLEHPPRADGAQTHAITVYEAHADDRERFLAGYRAIAHIGTDSDCPGTELAASLDRLSLEELLDVLAHLRAPYKPEHAYYLQHVQAALARKQEFRKWAADNIKVDTSTPLATDPYTMLSRSEEQDYAERSYPFEFRTVWAEVKCSNPPKQAVVADLFAEEDLAARFKIVPEALVTRTEIPDLDADSPAADIEALRALERAGFEPFFDADKNATPVITPDRPLSCAEFEALIATWQGVKDLPADRIREALEGITTVDGKTAWDVVSGFKTHVKAWLKIIDAELKALDWVVMSKKDFVKLVAKKLPLLKNLTTLQTFVSIEFVFTIPFEMWMDFASAQVQARSVWYLQGRLTAFRQWLRELSALAARTGPNFSEIDIDLTQVGSSLEPYYIARYMNERMAQYVHPNPAGVRLFAQEFKDGFDDQEVQMMFLGHWLMDQTKEVLSELLRVSDLDACKVEVLRKAGVIDLSVARAEIVKQFADELLDRLPRI